MQIKIAAFRFAIGEENLQMKENYLSPASASLGLVPPTTIYTAIQDCKAIQCYHTYRRYCGTQGIK